MAIKDKLARVEARYTDTVTIGGALLKAAVSIAPRNDIRYQLNVVHIRRGPLGTLLLVTDGHMLAMHCISKEPAPRGEFSFKPEPIASTMIVKSKDYVIAFDGDKAVIRAEYCDIPSVDRSDWINFPDQARFVPETIDREAQGKGPLFNTEYAAKARTFIEAANGVVSTRRRAYQNIEIIAGKPSEMNMGRPARMYFVPNCANGTLETLVVVMTILGEGLKGGVDTPAIFRTESEFKPKDSDKGEASKKDK